MESSKKKSNTAAKKTAALRSSGNSRLKLKKNLAEVEDNDFDVHQCKGGWQNTDESSYFVGPLVLLTLIYVDGTIVKGMDVEQKRPAINFWSYEQLKKREKLELDIGELGVVRLRNGVDVDELWKKKKIEEQRITPEKSARIRDKEGQQVLVNKMENMYQRILNEKLLLEETIRESRIKFPDSLVIDAFAHKVKTLFGYVDENGKSDVSNSEDEQTSMPNNCVDVPVIVSTETDEVDNNLNASLAPCSQWWHDNLDSIEEIMHSHKKDENKKKGSSNDAAMDFEPPSFSLGFTQEFMEIYNKQIVASQVTDEYLDVEPVSAIKPTKGNADNGRPVRTKRVAESGCSPFYVRIVDVNEGFNTEENQVLKYIQSGPGMRTDIVFQTREGVESILDTFHSLLPDNWVASPIIDCWSALLNLEEERRGKGARKRLFFHSGMLKDGMIDGSMS
ncbi:uncharacterized protein [Rutidosis leptorrhynchoides]|uniref:uncharacterized protein isoform X1 n=1 Tax=Rutidosis leptorrhynchoides TaxID=125765 RepID=UPI003A9A5E16